MILTSWPRLLLSTYTLYIYILYYTLGPFEALRSWNIGNNNNKLRSRRGRLPLGLVFWPVLRTATVVRARFLAAAFSDGSYLAHVNGIAYLSMWAST